MKKLIHYFSKGELALWGSSVVLIIASFCIFDRESYLTLVASLVGATSLIFIAKGNPIGQVLMIVFGILYGIISYSFAYYGEMVTFIGMTVPMAVISLVTWLRNPYNGNRSEVKVNRIKPKEILFMFLLSAAVTFIFYFVLKYFNTANLIPSTISITTSFVGVYLTLRRSPYFALAFVANDAILIILWVMATVKDISYLSVIVCFIMFLFNDLYGFYNWLRIERRQKDIL